MESGMKLWLLVAVIVLSMVPNMQKYCVVDADDDDHQKPQVPCFFIFGDSLNDNGNNNLLQTRAKVDYEPYGIDYPNGPTGRFGNGRTTVDIIAEILGFDEHIPPFTRVSNSQLLRGVNYASGSAGLLEETGKHFGDCLSLGKQLENHQSVVSRISDDILGDISSTKQHLEKCLYWVEIGNNDYIINYFNPDHYPSSRLYTPDQYADILIKIYSQIILGLYENGARKLALFGLGRIGCIPHSISSHSDEIDRDLSNINPIDVICVESMNDAVTFFNDKLQSLVKELNTNLTDAHFAYFNPYPTPDDITNRPNNHGFKVLNAGCCQVNEVGQCLPSKTPCEHRSSYYFWDSYHPTEAANLFSARRIRSEIIQLIQHTSKQSSSSS
ncbi:hypothetical protein FNV43_RR05895 [Rhamnella rubrinervis]|uniref:Uncharacterized protein n=1 Tax=Rhamnella rubrinervis TaxID=2594499 RepID=A0A8K0HCF1_9ROSA|nr:hypothetical protein FNV43_RR05895 [Rhamnella rubrinervis]